MQPFTRVAGVAIPFGRADVDTDLIIPSRFMKTVGRAGLGAGAFDALRQDADNLFDQPRHRHAPILIAGANFGCGSSREHAVWALLDLGVRVVVAPSFADIFAGNAGKNGMLTIALSQDQVDDLMGQAKEHLVSIDLQAQTLSTPITVWSFDIDPFRKHCLLGGVDEIALTEARAAEIEAYRRAILASHPWRLATGPGALADV
ncbi:3-isopropylmalate dehydratase small subunit [Caulobacter sp.]|uniref:3-isopropylmalate dehydratase small subunit n=1 Tax=Caulobacter sp. TaxID=78 RepID=UPI002B4725DF|nr:3-isopropylmalate dehydratase small subunit [Caulobacter sp.]HJV40923.1 3-isopropylmalate dehydratase small subunit [Caulobacter sp.]